MQFEAVGGDDFTLATLDFLVEELDHLTRIEAHHVVVVGATGDFEYRVGTVEVVPLDDAGGLELRQDAIDGGETDVFARFQQGTVDVFRAHVPIAALLQDFKDAQARQRGLQARLLEFECIHSAGLRLHVATRRQGWPGCRHGLYCGALHDGGRLSRRSTAAPPCRRAAILSPSPPLWPSASTPRGRR